MNIPSRLKIKLRQRSPIESLPAELVHKIFFQCLEFNFPRASIHIANTLSSSILYTWLIRLAFSSCNRSSRLDNIYGAHHFLPLDFFYFNHLERARIQTEILKCRWFTASLLRKCQREYVEHVIRQKRSHFVISPDENQDILSNLDQYWQKMNRFDPTPVGKRGKGDLVIRAHSLENNQPCKIAIWFGFGAFQIRDLNPVFQEIDIFRLPCAPPYPAEPCRMPDRLLTPPWTEDKLELLTLLSSDAYIDGGWPPDRSKAVLRKVIEDRELDVFRCLLNLHICGKQYRYPYLWPVSHNHFRIAARHAEPTQDPFLQLLFDRRKDSIPREDPAIMALMEKYSGTRS
ncbi:hypothetical protein MGYG_00272 [Nannizzia gypsea CBS 118893]|uniref:Uncharacterized protein n=1 Tax=Arthroderma gypseum (strain ATCC MYA-4604 / CBS 118893) TaxID=535722 RepID=E5QYD8_ARTGP|nr:hypothetical protein MGYG_00272 [Nannizzia gypsea CBS 118893]EFQ97230.1 hypothetical protein MGYG_00272 [Nannizzia gypsea CBS 118893]